MVNSEKLKTLSMQKKLGFLGSASDKESAYQCRNTWDAGLIPGWEDPMKERNATHSSCLENPMDRGIQWATVHGATKSQTQMNNWAHVEKKIKRKTFFVLIQIL